MSEEETRKLIEEAHSETLSPERAKDLIRLLSKAKSEMTNHKNRLSSSVDTVITMLESYIQNNKGVKEWLFKPIVVAIITVVVTAPISIYIGKYLESNKSENSEQLNIKKQPASQHSDNGLNDKQK